MRTQKLPNGNIAILADNGDRHELAELYRDEADAEQYVLESLHEILYTVQPEWIGAPTIEGDIYWFPNYMITDPYRELANCGRVVFTLAI